MYIFTLKRTGWVTAALLFLLVGCKKSTNDTVTPVIQSCLLQSDQTTSSLGGKAGTIYTYNGNGQLTSSVNSSPSATGTATSTTTTNTYTYDATGNLTSVAEREANSPTSSTTTTTTYEYNGGRLTNQSTQTGNSVTGITSYTYNASGQLTTYTDTQYNGAQSLVTTYNFSNGALTSATVSGLLSGTITVANGRITNESYSDGSQYRYTYDANGYNTKIEVLDAGVLQYYGVYEYATTSFQTSIPQPTNAPVTNLYGKTDLPISRLAVYDDTNTLDSEYRLTYQTNSKGYLTSRVLLYSVPSSGSLTSTTTYTYSNCQ